MQPYRIGAVVARHVYELRHNLSQLTNMVYFPVMTVVLWGFFTVYLRQGEKLEPNILSCLLSGIILWALFNAFQRDLALGFLEELWGQNLINLLGSPLNFSEYLAGLIAANLAKVMVGLIAELLVAWLFYRYSILPMLLPFVPFLFNLAFFALAVGLAITGLILRYTTKLQAMAWSVTALLMPLSCVLYPLKTLPGFLQPLAWSMPTTQSFEGMREAIDGRGFSTPHFAWGLGLNAVYSVIAILFFRWMFESARARGLLVKTA